MTKLVVNGGSINRRVLERAYTMKSGVEEAGSGEDALGDVLESIGKAESAYGSSESVEILRHLAEYLAEFYSKESDAKFDSISIGFTDRHHNGGGKHDHYL